MKPGKALCSAAPFLQRGAAIRRGKAADPDGLGTCSFLSVNAGSRNEGGAASFAGRKSTSEPQNGELGAMLE